MSSMTSDNSLFDDGNIDRPTIINWDFYSDSPEDEQCDAQPVHEQSYEKAKQELLEVFDVVYFEEHEALPLLHRAVEAIETPIHRTLLLAELAHESAGTEPKDRAFLLTLSDLLGREDAVDFDYAVYNKPIDPVALRIELLVMTAMRFGVDKSSLLNEAQALAEQDPGTKHYDRRMVTFMTACLKHENYEDEKITAILGFVDTVESEDGILKAQLLDALLKKDISNDSLRKSIEKRYEKATKKLASPGKKIWRGAARPFVLQQPRHLRLADARGLQKVQAPDTEELIDAAYDYVYLDTPKNAVDAYNFAADLGLWLASRGPSQPQK